MFYLNKLNQIYTSLRVHGLKFTLESAMRKRGLNVYSIIRSPITGIRLKVRDPYADWWKNIWEEGVWEQNCIKFVSEIITEGQTILDVGAWIGPYTWLFSKLMKGTGQVYAFEPDPVAYQILYDIVNKNSLGNVRIEKVALSDSIGKAQLRSAYRFGESVSSIVRFKQDTGMYEVSVETTTIDKYCEDRAIIPNGIKIDVEGAEGLVMEGGQNIIKKYSPWILLEFHSAFMSEKERQKNWDNIVKSAKKVIFIDGDIDQYHYGSEVWTLPDCSRFHIFIKY